MTSDIDALDWPVGIANFAETSRVWIYQSDRDLTEKECGEIDQFILEFSEKWTSHNQNLKATGKTFFSRFAVIVLDQAASNVASGCSIDKQVSFIQALSNHYNNDFMNRDQFLFYRDQSIVSVSMHSLKAEVENGQIKTNDLVFNNLVKTLGELHEKWLTPMSESWHSRFA